MGIDTFAAQHDEYGDYYDNDYYEMGGKTAVLKIQKKVARGAKELAELDSDDDGMPAGRENTANARLKKGAFSVAAMDGGKGIPFHTEKDIKQGAKAMAKQAAQKPPAGKAPPKDKNFPYARTAPRNRRTFRY